MTTFNKTQIVADLKAFAERAGSQNKAAKMLKNVSAATLSQIINGKHNHIADEMWRNIASQLKNEQQEGWQLVATADFKALTALLTDAKQHSNVFAITGAAGSGKSATMKQFVKENENSYRLSCSEYWNRKYFLAELLTAMGRDYSGLTVAEMMFEAISQLKRKEKPLLILDEADKLTDQVLYFFITLYNELEDLCGIVLCATDHLEKRIKRGLKLNKKGYQEIYSRMGRKCIELKGVQHTDVYAVCMENGVTGTNAIKKIWNECDGDLRRVKRLAHALKQQQKHDD
jgi:hypothetical protein